MKKIVFVVCALMGVTAAFAQETVNVPVGKIKNFWVDSPSSSSSYEWGIDNGGGTIKSGQGTSSIYVEFDGTQGTSTVWVRETNAAGCAGEKSYIDILRFKGATATIEVTGETPLCYENTGSELTVTFTGTPPFILKYTEGGLDKEIITSQTEYKISVPQLTKTTVYELVSVTDFYGVETPLTETATIEVLPQLKPLVIRHD